MSVASVMNITLSAENDYAAFIDVCDTSGVYYIKVGSEIDDGAHAIFHIAGSYDGQRQVKSAVSAAGSNGEQLTIKWPKRNKPVLCYKTNEHAPENEQYYHLKVI